MSDLETETTASGDTTTFDHFGKTWTVPVKRQHSHIRRIKQIARDEGGIDADDIALVYLPTWEYAELVALDVTESQLSDFSDAIAKAMGVGDKGNSQPS